MIKLLLIGRLGKMGDEVWRMAKDDPEFDPFYGLESKGHPYFQSHKPSSDLGWDQDKVKEAHVVIDFSTAAATRAWAKVVKNAGKPLVIGTTGFTDGQEKFIRKYSTVIPIVQSPNMSRGMNVLYKLVQLATEKLQPLDVDIIEMHHREKKDAPSGSAVKLGNLIQEVISKSLGTALHPTHSIRAGHIVGDHTVQLTGWGERLVLTHHAESRAPFAAGALAAAKWVLNHGPGLYSMQDVLGLTD